MLEINSKFISIEKYFLNFKLLYNSTFFFNIWDIKNLPRWQSMPDPRFIFISRCKNLPQKKLHKTSIFTLNSMENLEFEVKIYLPMSFRYILLHLKKHRFFPKCTSRFINLPMFFHLWFKRCLLGPKFSKTPAIT